MQSLLSEFLFYTRIEHHRTTNTLNAFDVLYCARECSAFDFQFGTITKWHEKAQYKHAIILYRQSTCEHNAQIT